MVGCSLSESFKQVSTNEETNVKYEDLNIPKCHQSVGLIVLWLLSLNFVRVL